MATARQLLADDLKRARVNAGFPSQEHLANRLNKERSTVAKVESGSRIPSPELLADWAEICGLDYDHYIKLAEVARTSEDITPGWFEPWLEREETAHLLRYWHPVVVPALLSTPDYRRAIVAASGASQEKVDERVSATLERQAVLERPEPPQVVTVIDETVLRRRIGAVETMRGQLEHLIRLSERPNIQVLVLPDGVGAHAGLAGPVNLASNDGMPDAVHMDGVHGSTSVNRAVVRAATVVFEQVRGNALSRTQTRELIVRVVHELWTNN